MKKTTQQIPPKEVHLLYREVGRTHVFTAEEFRGFHIGARDLKKAYEQAITALGEHVSLTLNCTSPVKYEAEYSYADFVRHLKGEVGSFRAILT